DLVEHALAARPVDIGGDGVGRIGSGLLGVQPQQLRRPQPEQPVPAVLDAEQKLLVVLELPLEILLALVKRGHYRLVPCSIPSPAPPWRRNARPFIYPVPRRTPPADWPRRRPATTGASSCAPSSSSAAPIINGR